METLKQEFGVEYYNDLGAYIEPDERLKKRLIKVEALYIVELFDIHDQNSWDVPKRHRFDSYEEASRFYLDH